MAKEDQVREAAYFVWLNNGCPEGVEIDCWLEAEAQESGSCCEKDEAATSFCSEEGCVCVKCGHNPCTCDPCECEEKETKKAPAKKAAAKKTTAKAEKAEKKPAAKKAPAKKVAAKK